MTCASVHGGFWSVVFFPGSVFDSIWYQANAVLIKEIRKYASGTFLFWKTWYKTVLFPHKFC